MTAYHLVDQAAAVLLMSRGLALSLGLHPNRFVYLHGCADAGDMNFTLNRPVLHRSPAMEGALREALNMAQLRFNQIEYVDFYTCFPCVPAMGWRMVGQSPIVGREGTLIGGLMFHGGPGANTSTHSIVAAVEKLRENPTAFALVHANGGIMCSQSVGIYSCQPPTQAWINPPQILINSPPISLTDTIEGPGQVETYTVLHNRSKSPYLICVVGRFISQPDLRFIAHMELTPTNLSLALSGGLDAAMGLVKIGNGGKAWFSIDPSWKQACL
eukprot:c18960_g1_i1.p1 GENE.c18960_g1_i1~~c18960_g1_i1.p1  ORF type:complete len:271 (+),score=51.65 c18960_g1_i1:157-969(+)